MSRGFLLYPPFMTECVSFVTTKASKYPKHLRSREPLIQSVDLRSDKTVRQITQQNMDTNLIKMLAVTSRELVAAEAHYHRSCYRQYTRIRTCVHIDNSEPDADPYPAIEREAYKKLCLLY